MRREGDGSRTVKSDETLISIIEVLLSRGETGVSRLSEELDRSPSTIHAHLATLEKYGFVISNGGAYELSMRFLEFGNKIRKQKGLYRAAPGPMEMFAEEMKEHIWCAVVEKNKIAFCASVSRERTAAQPVEIGSRLSMHETAIGKAVLAELPGAEVEKILGRSGLPSRTDNTITSLERLLRELDLIRERGYALNLEENVEGVNSIGTAISDTTGRPIGGLSVVGAANRLTEDVLRTKISQELIGTANEIELKLRYN